MAYPVKSEPILVTRGRSHWPIGVIYLALLGLAWPAVASAQNLLLGPLARRVKAKIELDPKLPTGPVRHRALALPGPRSQACSYQLPLCVAFEKASEPKAPQALEALERAYRRLVYAAGLPAPLTSNQALLWSLGPGPQGFSTELVTDLGASFEQAGLVCRSGATTASTRASDLEHDAWLCVGEAIAARLDAAEGPQARRAYAETLGQKFADPNQLLNDEARLTAALGIAYPYRTLAGRDDLLQSAATGLFFEYLENTLGTATPAALLTGLFALSAEPRKPETPRFVNEPDWLDALRGAMGDNWVELAHKINTFASLRAQLGQTEGPLSGYAWLGQLAPFTPDWVLPASTLPRRVASRHPVEPLGLVAVRIELDVPTQELTLALRVEWEEPVPFAWTVVKIDAQGRALGRLDFAFEPHVHFAEKHVTALEETRSLLVLGTNLGGIDATHLLDPDHAPFEPHGCTVYVVRM